MTVEVWVHGSFVRVSAPIDGGQCGRREELAKNVERPLLGRSVALYVVGVRATASFWNVPKKRKFH